MQGIASETKDALRQSQGSTPGDETRERGILESKTTSGPPCPATAVRTFSPFFERKYIIKDASVLPSLPSGPLLVRASPPAGKPPSADYVTRKEITPLGKQKSQLAARGPDLSSLPPLQSAVPLNLLSARAVHALEQLSDERMGASREASLEPPDWALADFCQDREDESSRLSSACMEEAITLFLDEERLLDDLDRVKPVRSLLSSESGGLLLPHSPRSKNTIQSKEKQGGATGSADTSSSPEAHSDTATWGCQAGSGTSQQFRVTSGGPGGRAGPTSALSVGAYHSISRTKVKHTEDRRHVVLTTLEWDRFKRVVTNLLSTNLSLRSKVRATQQHLRHLGYSGTLEQTVARLKNEELQMRRDLATREAHFAEAYSLRAKLEQCQQSLSLFSQPLGTSKKQIQCLQTLKTLLANAVRQTQITGIAGAPAPSADTPSPLDNTGVAEEFRTPNQWTCDRGCVKVHREIRVAANRCFVVSLHLRLPGRKLLSEDSCKLPDARPSQLAAASAATDNGLNERFGTAGEEGRRNANQSGGEGRTSRTDACPYPISTNGVGSAVGAHNMGEGSLSATSAVTTLQDLHGVFLDREITEDIKNQRAEVLVVSYDANTANVNIQALQLREFPAHPEPSFLEGLVRHVCSNLHVDPDCHEPPETPQCGRAHKQAGSATSKGRCLNKFGHAALRYRKPHRSAEAAGRAVTRQDEVDESLLQDTVENLVYCGYHQVTGDSSRPSHFYVSLYYRRAQRHVIARLFSPRSAELFVTWVDLFYALEQYQSVLVADSTCPENDASFPGIQKQANSSKTKVRVTSELLRFIGSRLRLTNERKVIFASEGDQSREEIPPGPHADREDVLVAPGKPSARTPCAAQPSTHTASCTHDANAQVEACLRQRLLERLSSPPSTSYINNQETLNLRQAHLLERTGSEAAVRGQSCFVLINSSVPLIMPRSISFIVYEPATGWCADSSFRLREGLEVLQRRHRTFLEKLRLDQATLMKLHEAIAEDEAPSGETSTSDVRGYTLENQLFAETVKRESPECDLGGSDSPRVAPHPHSIECPPKDTTKTGLAIVGPATAGAPSALASQNSSSCQSETSDPQPAEPGRQKVESGGTLDKKVPILTNSEWTALLGEIYRDLTVASGSLSLPGVTLYPTTVCS